MNPVHQDNIFTRGKHSVAFSADFKSLAVATPTGHKILSLNSSSELETIYECVKHKDVSIVEWSHSSRFLVLSSSSSPRELSCYREENDHFYYTQKYQNPIISVKLNNTHLVACLPQRLVIHLVPEMQKIHVIYNLPPNPQGLMALTKNSDEENSLLAYPGCNQRGEIQIFDLTSKKSKGMLNAHISPIAALTFNNGGSLLATASEKGTLIRVFSVDDGSKLFEFRRGIFRRVDISCLAFSPNSTYLCSSSNTETVHIFKLPNISESEGIESADEDDGWISYFGKVIISSATYLPSVASSYLTQDRAFAYINLPTTEDTKMCSFAVINGKLRLVVTSGDGFLRLYKLNWRTGGNCRLLKQFQLENSYPNAPRRFFDPNPSPSTNETTPEVSISQQNNRNVNGIFKLIEDLF